MRYVEAIGRLVRAPREGEPIVLAAMDDLEYQIVAVTRTDGTIDLVSRAGNREWTLVSDYQIGQEVRWKVSPSGATAVVIKPRRWWEFWSSPR